MKNETKNEMEQQMLSKQDETFMRDLKAELKHSAAVPSAQIDSFIMAAARQNLKKNQRAQKKRILFWSGSIAAAFAISFSILCFTTMQEQSPVASNTLQLTGETNRFSADRLANNTVTTSDQSNLAWTDVLTEISDLSDDFNEVDLDIAAVSAWDMSYTALTSNPFEK